jgi:acetyltransferase-like isoleucine patch superfamily enzyme
MSIGTKIMIAETAKIYPHVKLGKNITIEDYCIIGVPASGMKDTDLETVIGDDSIIRSHTVIYAGNKIGHHFQTGNKTNIRELNHIGNNVSIGTLSVVEHHVDIEHNVRIHSQVFIPEFTILKKDSWIGPSVVLTNASYPKSPNVKNELKGPKILENAIIGANSTILPGLTIGKNAIVGAGSVVTSDVLDSHVVVGNPAHFLKLKTQLPY